MKAKNITSTHSLYRPEIDGLRAFAVIAVIINHINKNILTSGYLGVDIFFVISGFVITSSLASRKNKDFKDFVSGFYLRRIKRLLPALSFFVLISSIAICFFIQFPVVYLKTGLASLFGFSNLYLLNHQIDYFAVTTELDIFAHTWSLGVEEQFYILFPLLVWFSGFGRETKNGKRNLLLIVGIFTITSLMVFTYLYRTNQYAAYFLMPTRFWEIASGSLIFIGLQKQTFIKNFLEKIPPLIILASIVGVMCLPLQWGAESTIAVVVLTSILIASLKRQTTAFKILTNQKIVYIGKISYSLYLWHWGVLVISRWTIGDQGWSLLAQILFISFISIASYEFIEKPIRNIDILKKTTILISGVFILVITSVPIVALGYFYENFFSGLKINLIDLNYWQGLFTPTSYRSEICHKTDKDNISTSLIETCTIGKTSNQTIFYGGNSHADQYREMHYFVSKNSNTAATSVTISGCIFPDNQKKGNCDNKSQAKISQKYIEKMKPEDLLVISNGHLQNQKFELEKTKQFPWLKSAEAIESLNTLNKKVRSKGGKTIIIMPAPTFNNTIYECIPHWFKRVPSTCKKSISSVREEMSDSLRLVEKKLDPTIVIYDPLEAVCAKKICHMIEDVGYGIKPLYTQIDHFSGYAVRNYISKDFLKFLIQNSLIIPFPQISFK